MTGAPAILHVVHNISSRLRKQLVLELEVWISGFELLEQLPSCFFDRQAAPLNEHPPDSLALLGLYCSFGLRQDTPIMRRRNNTRLCWCRTAMLFEKADMEYIMEARSYW
jgi:hypothetical protein